MGGWICAWVKIGMDETKIGRILIMVVGGLLIGVGMYLINNTTCNPTPIVFGRSDINLKKLNQPKVSRASTTGLSKFSH